MAWGSGIHPTGAQAEAQAMAREVNLSHVCGVKRAGTAIRRAAASAAAAGTWDAAWSGCCPT